MDGERGQGTISNVDAALSPKDLRARKPSGPGRCNRGSSNHLSPAEIHPSTRLIQIAAQPAHRRRVTAGAGSPWSTRPLREGQAESHERRFTARIPLYSAE
jgi:hypothetical protein